MASLVNPTKHLKNNKYQSLTNSSKKQKINKETQALNDTTDQIDLIDIYRTFYPKTADYTFFSNAHATFLRLDHVRPQNKSQ